MMNLSEIRKQKGITQKEAAKAANIAYQTYNNYENDKAIPPLDNLIKLADFFGCSIDYLVGREDEDGAIMIYGNQLSKDENQLIDKLRALPDIKKKDRLQIYRLPFRRRIKPLFSNQIRL